MLKQVIQILFMELGLILDSDELKYIEKPGVFSEALKYAIESP